ncbi:uncharacterized protein A4U43_C07F27310 [Asparagus officinalis]|uniref:Uncharacterized protein n=1 Tax=Asparagus officinalis TaxID=4686 RepID=A0A5P1EF84_ASPOF|nr:uncharacterized protein A4U43_C07F27310 [Asparagus officinalis]
MFTYAYDSYVPSDEEDSEQTLFRQRILKQTLCACLGCSLLLLGPWSSVVVLAFGWPVLLRVLNERALDVPRKKDCPICLAISGISSSIELLLRLQPSSSFNLSDS